MPRATPFDLVFASLAEERFPAIQEALKAAGTDPGDREAFLMVREVVELVRSLRPEEGVGEAIDQLVALLHHAFLFWLAGTPSLSVTDAELRALLAVSPAGSDDQPPDAFYVQLPERIVWAEAVPGTPPEPLDGCFLAMAPGGDLRVLGAFGLRGDRMGLSVVEVAGPRPVDLARSGGQTLFAPTLAGGDAAGLASVDGGGELLELGWRLHAFAAERSR